jgi:hypothetical protein
LIFAAGRRSAFGVAPLLRLGFENEEKNFFELGIPPLQNFVYLELYTKSPGFGAGKGGSRSLIYLGLQEGNNFNFL